MFANTGSPAPGMQYQAPSVPGSVPGPSATPQTVTPGPVPGTTDAVQAKLLATKAYNDALAQINGQRQSTLRSYGYLGDVDPNTGTLTNMRVDPNNPYGQYQEMLAQGDQDKLAAQNAAASRGLGHGGLAAQGLTAAQKNFGANSAQLGQQLMDTLSGLQSQQTSAYNTEQDAFWQAQQAAALQAIQSGAFDTPQFGDDSQIPAYDSGARQLPSSVAKGAAPKKAPAKAAPVKITPTNFFTDASSSGPKKSAKKPLPYKGRH